MSNIITLSSRRLRPISTTHLDSATAHHERTTTTVADDGDVVDNDNTPTTGQLVDDDDDDDDKTADDNCRSLVRLRPDSTRSNYSSASKVSKHVAFIIIIQYSITCDYTMTSFPVWNLWNVIQMT